MILTPIDGVRVWFEGGRYDVPSLGASMYDRTLWHWLGEIVVEGQVVSAALHALYVGARVDGLGTFKNDKGYLLDSRYSGTLGYNMESFVAYTAVAGYRVTEFVTFRMEYSHRDVDLVKGAASVVAGKTGNEDIYSAEFGLHF